MNRLSRALLAATTVTAVTVTGASFQTALAAPPSGSHGGQGAAHGGGHGKADVAKSDVRKVLRDIDRVTRKLDRAVRASRIDGLDQETQDALLANVEADKATLTALATTVSTDGDTTDLRQARKNLRDLREENYVLVVNVLRHAVHVGEAAADDAEATALVDSAVAKALAVTASSPKADVRAARADLVAAQTLLDDDADGTDETEPSTETEPEPSVEEPVAP
ncbi:MAG: hypothetical protein ACTHKG_21955, partial [Nocardioides sp.]